MEISGDVTDAGRTNNEQTLKIELLSQWKLEAEFRKNLQPMQVAPYGGQIYTPSIGFES